MQNKNYASGDVIETAVGYEAKISPAIVDDTVEADDDGEGVIAVFDFLPVPLEEFKDFLCTIEINGAVHVYRELHSYEEGDEYNGFAANGLAVEFDSEVHVYEADPDEDNPIISEGDEVKLVLEPISIKLSAAFRAAVKKAYVAVEPEPVVEDDMPLIHPLPDPSSSL